MSAFSEESAHSINGVPGRMYPRHVRPDTPELFSAQRWISERRPIKGTGYAKAEIQVEMRFDDSCKNGHATFAITADISAPSKYSGGQRVEIAGGCCHDEIAKVFPELAHLIRWHLCSTDGPMHYLANTLYHAGDRDHYGLRAGERRQIRNGRTGELCWKLEAVNTPDVYTGHDFDGADTVPLYVLEKSTDGDEVNLPPVPTLRWVPWCRVGDGKSRDLDAARQCAIWPNATDEELTAPREELAAKLEARLPVLLGVFRSEMHAAGLLWSPIAGE